MNTWVLLRGLARESGHWGTFAGLLQHRHPDARIVALDLPGNGSFNDRVSPTRIEAMTPWCRDRLRSQGFEPPYRLLAMSMGAMVAVEWAARVPQELAGCVLINTSLRPFSPWYRRLRPVNYAALLALALAPDLGDGHERTILQLTSRNPDAAAAVLDDWTHLRRTRPVSVANALRQLLAAARYRAPATPPAVPLLVLTSRGDRLVDSRCSQELARRWCADIAVHPSAGHDLTLDDAAWVADQIDRWLPALPLSTGAHAAPALTPMDESQTCPQTCPPLR
jgi:alpha-beta hydrolase superfamily lysophospholipase